MKTTHVTITKTDGSTVDGVRRRRDNHVDYADMCGNVIPEDEIKDVRDAD